MLAEILCHFALGQPWMQLFRRLVESSLCNSAPSLQRIDLRRGEHRSQVEQCVGAVRKFPIPEQATEQMRDNRTPGESRGVAGAVHNRANGVTHLAASSVEAKSMQSIAQRFA